MILTIKEINKGIMQLDNYNDLKEVYKSYMKRANELHDNFLSGFKGGDIVDWEHKGRTYRGEIIRINPKTVSVRELGEGFKWRISPQSLKLVRSREEKKG